MQAALVCIGIHNWIEVKKARMGSKSHSSELFEKINSSTFFNSIATIEKKPWVLSYIVGSKQVLKSPLKWTAFVLREKLSSPPQWSVDHYTYLGKAKPQESKLVETSFHVSGDLERIYSSTLQSADNFRLWLFGGCFGSSFTLQKNDQMYTLPASSNKIVYCDGFNKQGKFMVAGTSTLGDGFDWCSNSIFELPAYGPILDTDKNSIKFKGLVQAIALHYKTNRHALVVQHKKRSYLQVYDYDDLQRKSLLVANVELPKDKIRKVSFCTGSILYVLASDGSMYGAFVKNGNISVVKQRGLNRVRDFAIDPLSPYQIIFISSKPSSCFGEISDDRNVSHLPVKNLFMWYANIKTKKFTLIDKKEDCLAYNDAIFFIKILLWSKSYIERKIQTLDTISTKYLFTEMRIKKLLLQGKIYDVSTY
jgi:hypothetical protein